ncbi:hypothetical protein VPH35_121656 [Triticum aestivum]
MLQHDMSYSRILEHLQRQSSALSAHMPRVHIHTSQIGPLILKHFDEQVTCDVTRARTNAMGVSSLGQIVVSLLMGASSGLGVALGVTSGWVHELGPRSGCGCELRAGPASSGLGPAIGTTSGCGAVSSGLGLAVSASFGRGGTSSGLRVAVGARAPASGKPWARAPASGWPWARAPGAGVAMGASSRRRGGHGRDLWPRTGWRDLWPRNGRGRELQPRGGHGRTSSGLGTAMGASSKRRGGHGRELRPRSSHQVTASGPLCACSWLPGRDWTHLRRV